MQQHKPTNEQQVAIDAFGTGEDLVIQAGAGTGKTATLLMMADTTEARGQYIAFNKSITTEAQGKFPAHVAANTAHSLAFRAVGKKYAHRLNSRRMRSQDIALQRQSQALCSRLDGWSGDARHHQLLPVGRFGTQRSTLPLRTGYRCTRRKRQAYLHQQ